MLKTWLIFVQLTLSFISSYLKHERKRKIERESERENHFLSPRKSPPLLLPFSRFLLLILYCVHPTIRHLSVPGWVNSSIQRHYYAKRRAGGRIGKRGAGWWRWGKSCGCQTPQKRLLSQPFNSLSSKVKSFASKPTSNWGFVCVCPCI